MAGSAFGRDKWGGPKWGGTTPGASYIWGTVSLAVTPIPWAGLDWGTGLGGGRRSEASEVVSIEIPYDTLAPAAPTLSVSAEASALVLSLTPPSENADGTTCLDFKDFEVFYSSSSGIDVSDPTTYDGSFRTPSRQYTFATEETTYFRAVAWDQDGNRSAASSEISGTPTKPGTTIEDYSSNIKNVFVGAGMIGIEFQPPKSTWFGWAGWKLYYQYDSGSGWNGTWQLIYTGPGPGFLHKGLNESYKYKYKCTVLGEDGSETTGTISDNGGAGYQPNASDNSNLLSETIFAERIIATKEIISRTLIGGTLHSLNWTTSTGTEISLDDEIIRLGGSSVGFDSGTGVWLGNSSGTHKFFIGDSGGNKLTWDGTTLSVRGAIVAQSGSSIDGSYLVDLSVGTAKIEDAAITTAKIDDLAVTTAKIANAAITTAKIADLAVTTAKIADAAITSAKIDNLAVTNAKIADATITSAKIADAAITTAKIDDLAVTNAKIADATITSAKISDLTFDKITAGTNTASLVIGSGGYIKSANYSAGSDGFIIYGSGDAELNDVTVRGELHTGAGSELNADYLVSGTITGRTLQTAASGMRVVISADAGIGTGQHTLGIYDATDWRLKLGAGAITLRDTSYVSTVYLGAGADCYINENVSLGTSQSPTSGYVVNIGGKMELSNQTIATGKTAMDAYLEVYINGAVRYLRLYA